ncbi:spore germination protein [Neobacillus jeddahensis]|uniref:spore germination protein n=1 Tax=Neobacillus jeddahensis TaxID=1461580 RepID=UPI00058ABD29|nr:spore germination protein [Neobacillus jeddahensis]
MTVNREGITIGTISGGIVNFGGAFCISPISITKTSTGSGSDGESSGLSSDNVSGLLDVFNGGNSSTD